MRILFIGDIFGRSGRDMVNDYLPLIKQAKNIDFVIANAENSAHGKGISMRVYEDLVFSGIDVMTMGNHTFAKKDLMQFIDDMPRLVIPSNLPRLLPGQRSLVVPFKNKKIRITNMMGVVNMHPGYQPPFEVMDDLLKKVDPDEIHIVDFHAETTSEKMAFAYHYAGRVAAIVGTHTHVQTADEKIIKGTAYISDIGMTGPYESIIGCKIDSIVERMRTGLMQRFEPADGEGQLSAVIIEINEATHQAISIERLLINQDHEWSK